MSTPTDKVPFPLASTWWMPSVPHPSVPQQPRAATVNQIAEAAPAYGTFPCLPAGFHTMLADADRHAALAMLPDGRTLILLELFANQHLPECAAQDHPHFARFVEQAPVPWAFTNPHGVFCFTRNGGIRFTAPAEPTDTMNLRSSWVNLSDHFGLIGIYGGDSFLVRRHAHPINHSRDEFHWLPMPSVTDKHPRLDLTDRGTVLISGCPVTQQNELVREKKFARITGGCSPQIRTVFAEGRDGRNYIYAACFPSPSAHQSSEEALLSLPPGNWQSVPAGGQNSPSSSPCPTNSRVQEAPNTRSMKTGECRLWMES